MRKSILLAKKQVDDTITRDVSKFISFMQTLIPKFKYNVNGEVNYNETCVFVAHEG